MSTHITRAAAGAVAVIGLIAVPGCGGESTKSQQLSVTERDVGPKQLAYEGLKELHPGTVKLKFTNAGKAPHELQLLQIDGKHSVAEVKAAITKIVSSNGPTPVPDWLHPNGGVSTTAPGATATATFVLPKAGTYYAIDGGEGDGNGPPPLTQGAFAFFEAKGDKIGGAVAGQSTKVTIKDVGKDKFRFDNTSLKTGKTNLELDNTSKEIHHVQLFRLLPGKTAAEAKKALASNGPPSGPPPVDFQSGAGTTVIDSKQKLVSEIDLKKPGNYVMLCFISDRDGKGKPHLQEGLFKEVKVS
ncbi:MAG: hypothetical protein QOD76_1198 [Solirubrobacteraceae bacterium]|jgi:uncharacterized cupredoxin-like copper-binding protein|nr:hypothetical protein [Solirubrobacteraceae bacterium]